MPVRGAMQGAGGDRATRSYPQHCLGATDKVKLSGVVDTAKSELGSRVVDPDPDYLHVRIRIRIRNLISDPDPVPDPDPSAVVFQHTVR